MIFGKRVARLRSVLNCLATYQLIDTVVSQRNSARVGVDEHRRKTACRYALSSDRQRARRNVCANHVGAFRDEIGRQLASAAGYFKDDLPREVGKVVADESIPGILEVG